MYPDTTYQTSRLQCAPFTPPPHHQYKMYLVQDTKRMLPRSRRLKISSRNKSFGQDVSFGSVEVRMFIIPFVVRFHSAGSNNVRQMNVGI